MFLSHMISVSINKLSSIISESIRSMLNEGYLDDVYESENFKRWFSGSKMVDKNGRPLLLGHATRSFGFSEFNTPFIHLSSMNDASYFSGGNLRMFKDRNTLNKLSPEDILNMYNRYCSYGTRCCYLLDDTSLRRIMDAYENEFNKLQDKKHADELKSCGIDVEEYYNSLETSKNALLNKFKKSQNDGETLFYLDHNESGLPLLSSFEGTDEGSLSFWLKNSFPSTSDLKEKVLSKMPESDEYLGVGGTYALCARVLNPLYIDCHGDPWSKIYIRPDSCEAYDGIFDIWEREGKNTQECNKGTWFPLDNESIAWCAKELGYDGVVFKNIKEGGLEDQPMAKTYIVFSSKQLKSPFENNGEFGDVNNIFK